jgi:hypothetical protein
MVVGALALLTNIRTFPPPAPAKPQTVADRFKAPPSTAPPRPSMVRAETISVDLLRRLVY